MGEREWIYLGGAGADPGGRALLKMLSLSPRGNTPQRERRAKTPPPGHKGGNWGGEKPKFPPFLSKKKKGGRPPFFQKKHKKVVLGEDIFPELPPPAGGWCVPKRDQKSVVGEHSLFFLKNCEKTPSSLL
jgi:hypothetical protein